MSETDTRTPQPRDIIRAAHLLSRLPLPGGDATRTAEAAWAWPIIGVAVACIQIIAGLVALAIGLPPSVAAGAAIAAGLLSTGGLHEDGLADCADGFWGGITREHRLEILKDSRIGAYGVLGLIVTLGLRWALFAALLPIAPLALIASAMLSRAAMAATMHRMSFARVGGLAAHVGKPPRWAVLIGLTLSGIGAVLTAGLIAGLAAAIATLAATLLIAATAKAKIGGQTGDVLGAAQVVGEIFALAACAALLS